MAGRARRADGASRTRATRAAIIDALPLVWRGLAGLLGEIGVSVVAGGRHADLVLRDARRENADLVVVGRPIDSSASDAVRAAAALPTTPGIVALASTRQAPETLSLLEAGAFAVVARSAPEETIKRALSEVAAGRHLITEDLVGPLLAHRYGDERDARPLRQLPEGAVVSAREQAVLEGLAAGLTNQQIADRLYLSPATVKTHVAHLARKLGTGDRRSTVAAAIAAGLLG